MSVLSQISTVEINRRHGPLPVQLLDTTISEQGHATHSFKVLTPPTITGGWSCTFDLHELLAGTSAADHPTNYAIGKFTITTLYIDPKHRAPPTQGSLAMKSSPKDSLLLARPRIFSSIPCAANRPDWIFTLKVPEPEEA